MQEPGFELAESGAWNFVEKFFKSLPANAIVYWVTFSVGPSEADLKKLRDLQLGKNFRLRLICRNPLAGNGPGVTITKATFSLLQKFKELFDGAVRAYPAATDAGLFDEDESLPGPLHAKFLVATSAGEPHSRLLSGSFNFANWSLSANSESVFETEDFDEAKRALEAAQRLYNLAEDLEEKHCGRRYAYPPGEVKHGPRDGTRSLSPEDYPESINEPEDLRKLADALDEMLKNYPPSTGGSRQYEIYLTLERAARRDHSLKDLLYLPVGVGKTFIALRWLVFHLHSRLSGNPPESASAVYLTPNEWVQKTVENALVEVSRRAGVASELASNLIRIIRPSGVSGLTRSPAAVVADECQNWNPSGSEPILQDTYTNVLDRWRKKKIPVLGLSATPCRMEEQRFDPISFIKRFLDRDLRTEEEKPFMDLNEAIEEGFICRPAYEVLLGNKTEEVERILTNDTGCLVGFGEYSQTTLRKVWEVLAEDPRELAQTIAKAFKKHDTKRAVIFLPPVDQAADDFVAALSCELGGTGNNGGVLFDFRSRSSAGGKATSVFDDFAATKKKSGGYPPVLLTVDRFGEGVSINDIDMLVMLRATLSPRVAMQALGRGLRPALGKNKCVVLDAVLFQRRVEQWEKALSPEGQRSQDHKNANEAEEVHPNREDEKDVRHVLEGLGDLTAAKILKNEAYISKLANALGLSRKAVVKNCRRVRGQSKVRYIFEKWLIADSSGSPERC